MDVYLVSFEIVFYLDYPTNRLDVDILYQNDLNERIFLQYILHPNLNIYTNKKRRNQRSIHVVLMEDFQQHVLNPNQQHNPNESIKKTSNFRIQD